MLRMERLRQGRPVISKENSARNKRFLSSLYPSFAVAKSYCINVPDFSRYLLQQNNIFHPSPPSLWERIRHNPSLFIAQWLYTHQPPTLKPPTSTSQPIKIVCISDTHNEQPCLPNGDILIHAGDLTINGSFAELQAQLGWINALPHAHKLVTAGNHDLLLDQKFYTRYPNTRLAGRENDENMLGILRWGDIIYLNQSSATINIHGRTIRIFGSPMTPQYGNWAFQHIATRDYWTNTIPPATDILISHGPAKGHVDDNGKGCSHLNRELWRVRPRLHVCGHIHRARSVEHADWGWVHWGYDTICRGEGRIFTELVIFSAWLWMWVCFAVLGPRKSVTTFVNAAVQSAKGVVEGHETTVVEI
ncbi:Metallo-dependent phosphatase-like protein [Pyrenochaeta sp. MPI-SDFR-AT-0127]|nr:Metallo-dependent phosphatase-like protein [Pyrenochaeta sp. MPI-SDFR-AT-0127]